MNSVLVADRTHCSTTLPLSYYGIHGGSRRPESSTSNSAPPSLESLGFQPPHPAQQRIIEEARRFNVAVCGRRFGKTQLLLRLLSETALEGFPAAYFTPTYPMAEAFYGELCELLGPVISRRVQGHRIELTTGGLIDLWSMDNGGDRARGRKYKRAGLDEVAMVSGLAGLWEKVVRPTLTDYAGDAWFASTPRRGGTFEELYLRGQEDDAEWMSWQLPSRLNPHLPEGEIEAARLGMSVESFAQEFEADFEASETDLVYPEASMVLHGRESIPVPPSEWRAHVVGIDPGGGDPTAIVPIAVWRDLDPTVSRTMPSIRFHQHDEFYRRGDVSTEDVIAYLHKMNRIAPLTKVLVAETGGNIITNTLIGAGFPAERYIKERGGGLDTVRWLLQSNRLSIAPSCANSWAEFATYRWKPGRDMETGERYATSTPGSNHGDAMDARRAGLQWAVDALRNGENLQRQQSGGKQVWGAEVARRKKPGQVWAK